MSTGLYQNRRNHNIYIIYGSGKNIHGEGKYIIAKTLENFNDYVIIPEEEFYSVICDLDESYFLYEKITDLEVSKRLWDSLSSTDS